MTALDVVLDDIYPLRTGRYVGMICGGTSCMPACHHRMADKLPRLLRDKRYLLVSEADLATALHRSGLTCDDVKPLAPAHYETDHHGDGAALFAALTELAALGAAQEKGEAG